MKIHRVGTHIVATCILSAVCFSLQAENYPSRSINIIVPLAPGDTGDTAARAMGEELSRILKTPIVIVNRPGAGGALAAESVVKAPHDGYTILFTQNSALTYRPVMEPQTVSYDPVKDFTPLGLASRSPMVLAVRQEAPYRTFKELVDFAKANQGQIRLGTPGIGSAADFSINLMNALTDAGLVSVAFNGSSPAVTSLRGEHIEGVVLTSGTLAGHFKSGALRGLTISDKTPEFPDVPTMQELGYQQGIFGVWFAYLGPSGLPADVTKVLVPAIRAAVESPTIAARLLPLGIVQAYGPPERLTARIREEHQALQSLAKKAVVLK